MENDNVSWRSIGKIKSAEIMLIFRRVIAEACPIWKSVSEPWLQATYHLGQTWVHLWAILQVNQQCCGWSKSKTPGNPNCQGTLTEHQTISCPPCWRLKSSAREIVDVVSTNHDGAIPVLGFLGTVSAQTCDPSRICMAKSQYISIPFNTHACGLTCGTIPCDCIILCTWATKRRPSDN